jgi:hypothetical protein
MLRDKWDAVLDARYLYKIPSIVNVKEFATKNSNVTDFEMWYIISANSDIDGKIAEFGLAFDKVYGRGFGSLIVNLSGDRFYLETKMIDAKQNIFIGKK